MHLLALAPASCWLCGFASEMDRHAAVRVRVRLLVSFERGSAGGRRRRTMDYTT